MLNGIVNYETWVPSKTLMTPAAQDFFMQYQEQAKGQGIDPLGYYLGGWGYSYIQVLGNAVAVPTVSTTARSPPTSAITRSRQSWATSPSERMENGRSHICSRFNTR